MIKSLKNFWGGHDSEIRVTKLVTEYGEMIGNDDMLELLEVGNEYQNPESIHNEKIWYKGCMHLAFGVKSLDNVLEKVKQYGGQIYTSVQMSPSGNRWCFCRDPEGNWIELIERKQ